MELAYAGSKGKLTVSDNAFGQPFNEALVHQVVVAHMAAARQGSKAQKSRSAVSGGGKKPWRQKGTGRARAGSIRSPLWRTGGVTFAAKPRSYKQKVNKKVYRGAMRAIFSELARLDRLHVVKALEIAEPKTKLLLEQLAQLNIQNAVIISEALEPNIVLAARNLPHVTVQAVNKISPVELISYENVVITEAALKKVEEWLQ